MLNRLERLKKDAGMIAIGATPALGTINYITEYLEREDVGSIKFSLYNNISKAFLVGASIIEGICLANIIEGEYQSALISLLASAFFKTGVYIANTHYFRRDIEETYGDESKKAFPLGDIISYAAKRLVSRKYIED